MPLTSLRRTGVAAPPVLDSLEPGRILNTPADSGDDVLVALDSFSADQPIGPVHGWRRLPEESWPQAGDGCLVAQPPASDTGDVRAPWLVAWEPA